jgi:stress-induced morphogen
MEAVITRVQKALQKEFLPREIRLNYVGRGKFSGWIISKSFDELTDEQRHQKVWKLLEANLNEKDRDRILGFFTFTPLEEKMLFDESFDMLKAPVRKKSSAKKKTSATRRKNSRLGQKRR